MTPELAADTSAKMQPTGLRSIKKELLSIRPDKDLETWRKASNKEAWTVWWATTRMVKVWWMEWIATHKLKSCKCSTRLNRRAMAGTKTNRWPCRNRCKAWSSRRCSQVTWTWRTWQHSSRSSQRCKVQHLTISAQWLRPVTVVPVLHVPFNKKEVWMEEDHQASKDKWLERRETYKVWMRSNPCLVKMVIRSLWVAKDKWAKVDKHPNANQAFAAVLLRAKIPIQYAHQNGERPIKTLHSPAFKVPKT